MPRFASFSSVSSAVGKLVSRTFYRMSLAASVNEGSSTNISVVTRGLGNGSTLYWTIDSSAEDFETTSGSVTINQRTGTFSITAIADATTEGPQTAIINLRTGSTSGPIVASGTIIINDTSTTPPAGPVTLSPGDFSNGFSSVGVAASYLLVAIPAGTYNITITNLTLDGFGAQVLLSTDQAAIDGSNPGVFANFGLDEFSPGPTTYTFTGVTSAEPFYIIFDASTGELTATGVSYTPV